MATLAVSNTQASNALSGRCKIFFLAIVTIMGVRYKNEKSVLIGDRVSR